MSRIPNLRLKYGTALLAAFSLSACYHSTRLAATWRDPNSGPLHFRQPVVVFVAKSETFRRTMEDKLAAQFPNASPSYKVIRDNDVGDGTKILSELDEAGFDGAVIMRVANVDQRITYTPGAYWYGGGAPYYSFAGYWGTAWGYPYDPGYIQTDQIVSIETQIYSLKNDKLLWAGRSETTDPKSVGKLGDSVIKHIMQELRKEGMVALLCGGSSLCERVAGH